MARADNLWFSFNGVASGDMGVRVARLPDIPVAEARGAAVEIPGRDGALWLPDDALRPVTMRATIELGAADPGEVAAWLSGSGALTLSTLPDHYWPARVTRGFELRAGAYPGGDRRAEVEFACQPFRYRVGDPELEPIEAPGTFPGDGNWPARPVVTVYGAGDITLMLNGASALLDGVDGHITLDCDAMLALRDGESASPSVTLLSEDGAWPTLVPGLNRVNWTGDVTRVVIRPNWRWR